ncbi:MAG: TlpA disulfide reductase family protein [Pseudomonadota bacterium]|jgi:thiol-disulfide isomerase/thioredoxin
MSIRQLRTKAPAVAFAIRQVLLLWLNRPGASQGMDDMRRIGVVLLGLMLCFSARAEIQPGETPPDALGTTQHGEVVSVSSLHGKVVVISFWATWCGYCMKEMPVLANLQSLATERNLPLQVVSINSRESRDVFVRSSRALRKSLPGLLITWDSDAAIGKPYGADKAIPVMVMLHRDGTVAHVHVGYGEDMLDSLVAEINALLAEPASSPAVAGIH